MNKSRCLANVMSLFLPVLAFTICAFPIDASAEGRCPPGQYPIGGEGVGGCAPIETSGGGESASPQPTGRWIKTWGAIAFSSSGDAGASKNKFSKSEASKEAIAQCAQWGAKDCKVSLAFKNQCAAVVQADRGKGTRSNTGETEKQAVERATQDCTASRSETCKVIYSGCSEPFFEKF